MKLMMMESLQCWGCQVVPAHLEIRTIAVHNRCKRQQHVQSNNDHTTLDSFLSGIRLSFQLERACACELPEMSANQCCRTCMCTTGKFDNKQRLAHSHTLGKGRIQWHLPAQQLERPCRLKLDCFKCKMELDDSNSNFSCHQSTRGSSFLDNRFCGFCDIPTESLSNIALLPWRSFQVLHPRGFDRLVGTVNAKIVHLKCC